MATAITTTAPPQKTQNSKSPNRKNDFSRNEIQEAIARAVELRAIHAALMQGNSPPNIRLPTASPPPQFPSAFTAQDYPVFTPSYESEPLPGYQQIQLGSQNFSGNWDVYGLGGGSADKTILSDYNESSRMHGGLMNSEPHVCPVDDQISIAGSCTKHLNVLQASPEACRFTPQSLGESQSLSSCNKCKPGIITTETDGGTKSVKSSNVIVPLPDSHYSVNSQPKHRGLSLSWLFPRIKKKHKNENSPNRTELGEVSRIFEDLGIMSIETLKKELMEANESRDAALMEVTDMKSSIGDLKQRLGYLETYCEELKNSLRQAVQAKDSQVPEKVGNLPKRGKFIDGNGDNLMPVSEEVMVEGFLQIVSEARLSVKQFCKLLVGQVEETDTNLVSNINLLLQPYKLSLNSKYSKAVSYHLEALISQSLYQDFENCVFQTNGSQKLLDPEQDRQAQFTSFVALRNLSWNEVLRKGTKYYSEEFSKFCDQKMSCIITTLNWTKPWPEQLLQGFFVTAKCIWLLHLLAFSFTPPIGILRVEENRSFDPHYMEDIFIDRQRSHGPSRVKIMVTPGFYVQERVLKCKVLCRYKSVV